MPFASLEGQPGSGYGSAVALSKDGHTLVVGSRLENMETGAMRMYRIDGTTVTLQGKVGGLTSGEKAGHSVAVSDSILLLFLVCHGY